MEKKSNKNDSEEQLTDNAFIEQMTLGVISDFIKDKNSDNIGQYLQKKRKSEKLNINDENITENFEKTEENKKMKKKLKKKKIKSKKIKNKK